MSIGDLGWNDYCEAVWNEKDRGECVPARVVAQQRGLWRVAGDFAECWAEASGALRLAAQAGGDWPTVGDWVTAEKRIGEARASIQEVLPRRSKFSRKEAGKRVAEQVIAANVDKAVIVAALDGDFNLRRIERYMTQIWESGAQAIVVLNKADVCAGAEARVAEVEKVALATPVHTVSAKTGQGMEALEASLRRAETLVFLGSSGVGKSTLVNWLLGTETQATAAVRQSDSRGRHTTTARELFVARCGALVMDTPGLRELQLWDAREGVAEAFADIAELAAECHFRDCTHASEPGCAVRQALEKGTLDAERLENQRKLAREEEFLSRKVDPEKQQEYKKRIKLLFRAIRRNAQSRNKDKK